MDLQQRIDRLDKLIADGLLIRNEWTGERAGRETACLLAALSPEAGEAKKASACPATVMPVWLANLTPYIDDRGSLTHWPDVVRRYASLARRWLVLDAETWRRLDYACRAVALREARKSAEAVAAIVPVHAAAAMGALDEVLALLDRAAAGEMVPEPEWRAAQQRASAAAAAAAEAAWRAAEAAAWRAAEAAAAAAAAWRAAAAAWRAAEAAAAAAAAWRAAAPAEAADRIIDGILDAIEAAVLRAEKAVG